MKTNKKSSLSNLPVDVIEYLFIEWLVRRGLFSAYKANFEAFHPNHRPFRNNLRAKLRRLCRSRIPSVGALISTSFPFAMTPEGYNFWVDQSNLWDRFCDKFKSIFLNYVIMTQIHVVVRRINPALKIDLVQVGHVKDGQFVPIPFDSIANSPIASYLKSSYISDSRYVNHSRFLTSLVLAVFFLTSVLSSSTIPLFLCLTLNLTVMKARRKKKGKGTKVVTRPLGGRVL